MTVRVEAGCVTVANVIKCVYVAARWYPGLLRSIVGKHKETGCHLQWSG